MTLRERLDEQEARWCSQNNVHTDDEAAQGYRIGATEGARVALEEVLRIETEGVVAVVDDGITCVQLRDVVKFDRIRALLASLDKEGSR